MVKSVGKPLLWCLLVFCLFVLIVVIVVKYNTISSVVNNRSKPSALVGHDQWSHRSEQDYSLHAQIIFPHGSLLHSVDYLVKTKWIKQLQSFLQQHSNKLVVMVTANYLFLDILLNWLAAAQHNAQINIETVLILSMDSSLHEILSHQGITSILVNRNDVIRPSAKLPTQFSHYWIIRCTVTRLLNYWGFHVAMFDVDAVILKDPRPLFQKYIGSDIVGSQGKYPFELHRKWGVTLCMGVVLFRSTSSTELFWTRSNKFKHTVQDDQVKINHVLDGLNIEWYTSQNCKYIDHCAITGLSPTGLNVTLLPHDLVCRSCDLNNKPHYYIWHGRASRKEPSKESKAKEGGVWFLREDWKAVFQQSNLSGNNLIRTLLAIKSKI